MAEKLIPNIPLVPGDCLVYKDDEGRYIGIILIKKEMEDDLMIFHFGHTRIRQSEKPTLQVFFNSYFLVCNFAETMDGGEAFYAKDPTVQIWGCFVELANTPRKQKAEERKFSKLETIGRLNLLQMPVYEYSAGIEFISRPLPHQYVWEQKHPEDIDLSYPINSFFSI